MTTKCYKEGFKDGEFSHILSVHLSFNPICNTKSTRAETAIELLKKKTHFVLDDEDIATDFDFINENPVQEKIDDKKNALADDAKNREENTGQFALGLASRFSKLQKMFQIAFA